MTERMICIKGMGKCLTKGNIYRGRICRSGNGYFQILIKNDKGYDHILAVSDRIIEGRDFVEEYFDLKNATEIKLALNIA